MRKEHSDELERLQARYGDKENKMRSEYESHILGLRSEKNADEKSHSQLQEDFKRERTRLITELYQLKAKLNELEATIRELRQSLSLAQLHAQSQT
jgi:uncharacterized coiled-coil DUF342 family protein